MRENAPKLRHLRLPAYPRATSQNGPLPLLTLERSTYRSKPFFFFVITVGLAAVLVAATSSIEAASAPMYPKASPSWSLGCFIVNSEPPNHQSHGVLLRIFTPQNTLSLLLASPLAATQYWIVLVLQQPFSRFSTDVGTVLASSSSGTLPLLDSPTELAAALASRCVRLRALTTLGIFSRHYCLSTVFSVWAKSKVYESNSTVILCSADTRQTDGQRRHKRCPQQRC